MVCYYAKSYFSKPVYMKVLIVDSQTKCKNEEIKTKIVNINIDEKRFLNEQLHISDKLFCIHKICRSELTSFSPH